MRFVQKITGYTKVYEKKKNAAVRQEFQSIPLTGKIKNYRINWKEHIYRMNESGYQKEYQNIF